MVRSIDCSSYICVLLLVVGVVLSGGNRTEASEFADARQQLARGQYSQALLTVEDVLATGSTVDQASALELKATAHYGLGNEDRARETMRELLTRQPSYQPQSDMLSPRMEALFAEVKDELVGYLTVDSTPSGARVLVDDDAVGVTPLYSEPLLIGNHTVRLDHPGYDSRREPVDIRAGKSHELEVHLEPNAAWASIVTVPAGVKVFVDGESMGVTPPRAITAQEREQIRRAGADPTTSSGVLTTKPLAPGSHTLTFQKRCYESQRRQVKLEVGTAVVSSVELPRSTAHLTVTATEPDAHVTLGDRKIAITPVRYERVCAGPARLRVHGGDRSWVYETTLDLEQDEHRTVEAHPRPTLWYVGPRGSTSSSRDELDRTITSALTDLTSLNIHVERLDPVPAPAELRTQAARKQRDLILVAEASDSRVANTAELRLWSVEHDQPDVRTVAIGTKTLTDAIQRLDHVPPLWQPWLGLHVVDVAGIDHPIVATAPASSSVASADVLPGDELIAVDGNVVENAKAFDDMVASHRPGHTVDLTLKRATTRETTVASLAVERGYQTISADTSALWHNRVLADALLAVNLAPTASIRVTLLRLQAAIAYLHHGKAAAAWELLRDLQLPEQAGISAGTIAFWRGEALRGLGRHADAQAAYRHAVDAEQATLWRPTGPEVSIYATRRLERYQTTDLASR